MAAALLPMAATMTAKMVAVIATEEVPAMHRPVRSGQWEAMCISPIALPQGPQEPLRSAPDNRVMLGISTATATVSAAKINPLARRNRAFGDKTDQSVLHSRVGKPLIIWHKVQA